MKMSMDNNKGDKSFKLLDKYFKEVVTRNFHIEGGGRGITKVSDKVFKGSITLPTSFNAYKETDYYEDPVGKEYIHFTSLSTFFKIINSGYFLATQFDNHDDPLELLFAGELLSQIISKNSLEKLKENVFSLSMCEYPFKDESFDMWRIYGDRGRGIGIVFSFYPNTDGWNNSFLSKMYYGNDPGKNGQDCLNKFRAFQNAHKRFLKTHQDRLTLVRNEANEEGIGDTLNLFLAFHKSSLYKIETEVRFLKSYLFEKKSIKDEALELILNKKNELSYAYRIPIVSSESLKRRETAQQPKKRVRGGYGPAQRVPPTENPGKLDILLAGNPFIVIKRVILGYEYSQADLERFQRMEGEINSKIGYFNFPERPTNISFELSKLSKQFHNR